MPGKSNVLLGLADAVGRTSGDDGCAGEVVVYRGYEIKDDMCGKR